MRREAVRHLPAEPTTPRAARRFIDLTLDDWAYGDLRDLAVLLTCELVTNAVLHTRSEVLLRVTRHEDGIRVEVADDDLSTPQECTPAPVDKEATTGRGLLLVDQLSTDWGVQSNRDGKVVWFDLSASSP